MVSTYSKMSLVKINASISILMKKLLILLFSLFFLYSPSVFAQEDLSMININNLQRLSGSEIISTFSNTTISGYYSKEFVGEDDYRYVEHIYANGDFDSASIDMTASGIWKINGNEICSKATKVSLGFPEKMYTCLSIYTALNKGEYYFYMESLGVYAKSTHITHLID